MATVSGDGARGGTGGGEGPDPSGRADQLGAIIVRSLDLAEAGLSLGLTVLTRAGAVAQESVFDRGGREAGDAPEEPAGDPGAAAPPAEDVFYLTNRLPLAPGGSVRVSFSISNDAVASPKRVAVRAEGFVGEGEGAALDPSALRVRPATKTIAPMDFEKFVLTATVPPETPPDVYRGVVVVTSSEETRIPVRLQVTPS
jgi:hypothetical protein